MRTVMIPSETKHSIPYYENSYDTLGNKAQRYHTMRTVMIPSETKHSEYNTMRTVMITSETKHSNIILWEQLWYPRKQSTAIPYYDNSYDSIGNKAQQYHTMRTAMIPSETKHSEYHTMRTVMIPSETKHSNTILWEQLWYPRKQSTAIPYYENSNDTLGSKAQQYHTMRTVMIPSETKHSS